MVIAIFAALCFVAPPAVMAFGHGGNIVHCLTHGDAVDHGVHGGAGHKDHGGGTKLPGDHGTNCCGLFFLSALPPSSGPVLDGLLLPIDAYLPSALPGLPGSTRSVKAIEQDALNARVDVQMARLEMEVMANSYGLTRKTHFLNVLDASGVSKTQKDRVEKHADGGGYELVVEVPLFDFGKANVREAEQRYLEAANRLGQLGVNAA